MAIPKKVKRVETGIFKLEDGRWLVEFRPGGRDTKRYRKIKDTLTDARQAKQGAIAHYQNGEPLKPARDPRRLTDIFDQWHKYHGHTLTSGDKQLQTMKLTAEKLGNPQAIKCTPLLFLEYRSQRLEEGVSANHLNHELSYLKSAFNELDRIGQWRNAKPFDKIKKLKIPSKDVCYLSKAEIKDLLQSAGESRNPDLLTVVKICLATGARYGEASELEAENIRNGKINFINTKNGRNRTVPISSEFEAEIRNGRAKRGELFQSCWESFKYALGRTNITLPKGQKTHVLRHTFASHFVMNGGDFLVLNKILGHETIQMTMVYAHLAPDHLEDAKTMNPLCNL